MPDELYYGALGCLLLGILLAALRDPTVCRGNCSQGRKECDCKLKE